MQGLESRGTRGPGRAAARAGAWHGMGRVSALALVVAVALGLTACGGGKSDGGTDPVAQQPEVPPFTPVDAVKPGSGVTADYVPLYVAGTQVVEQIQVTEPDGTLVTYMGARPTDRHARERGEAWDAPDAGPGRYFTFPTRYFQHRTFGLEIRDEVPAGRQKITIYLHVNDGTFDGTTFSLFRNIENPNVRDFGWSLNYGFNNPNEGNRPVCHAGRRDCSMSFSSNWRTSPHSTLKIGDK